MSQNLPFQFGGSPPQSQPFQQHQNPPPPPQQVSVHAMPAQPNAVPPIDPKVLQTIQSIPPDQLMAFINMLSAMQAAQPQATPLQLPIAQAPPPHTSVSAPQTIAPAPVAAPMQSVSKDVDMDKEDGELEEGEELETAPERGFLRPPPTGPRKRSESPRDAFGRSMNRRVSHQPASPPLSSDAASRRTSGQQTGNASLLRQASSPTAVSKSRNGNGQVNGNRRPDKEPAARAFVLHMHKAGYTFEQLAQEVPNTKALRRMYQALKLPLKDESASNASHTNGITPVSAPPQPQETRMSSITKPVISAVKPKLPDRAEYLKRLANAKKPASAPTSAKPAEQPTPSPVQATLPTSETAALPVTVPDVASTSTPAPAPAQSNGQQTPVRALNNELLKQRLAHLKAQNEAKLQAKRANDAAASSSPIGKLTQVAVSTAASQPSPGFTIATRIDAVDAAPPGETNASSGTPAEVSAALPAPSVQQTQAQPPPVQTLFSPPPPTPGRSFSALPGLFMASTPIQASPIAPPQVAVPPSATVSKPPPPVFNTAQGVASPVPSPAPFNINRKRPVAADFGERPASTGPTMSKRPAFRESRSGSEADRIVISDSGDEDDEMKSEQTPVQPPRGAAKVPNLPPRPSFALVPNTPGSQVERDKAIAELRARIKKKEAAKAARESGNATPIKPASSGGSTPMPNATAPLAVDTAIAEAPQQPSPQVSAGANAVSAASERSMSASAIARQQERAQLESRFKELQAQIGAGANGTAVAKLVEAAAAEPTMSRAVLSEDAVIQDTPAMDITAQEAETAESVAAAVEDAMVVSSDEAGEIDDGGALLPTEIEGSTAQLNVPTDDRKVGSQATTASASSHAEDTAGEETIVVDMQAIDSSAADDETTVVEAMNVFADGSAAEAAAMPEVNDIATNAAGQLAGDEDESMDEDSSDEDDDSDDSRLSDENDLVVHAALATTNGVQAEHEGTAGRTSSSDASSTIHVSPKPAETAVGEMQEMDEDDDDEYEPEPATPVASVMAEQATVHPPESIVGEANAQAQAETISAAKNGNTIENEETEMAVDDDLAPELQPPKAEQLEVDSDQEFMTTGYYRPYESPLIRFKDFRYHPEFLTAVPGGYKSLTYSHHIDPELQLCTYEAVGGKCNDSSCEFQHFRSMSFTDNDLLKELGTHRIPTSTPEDRNKWNAGLSALVKELRSTKQGKDANAIATRIAKYRREFINDTTKIVWLGGAA